MLTVGQPSFQVEKVEKGVEKLKLRDNSKVKEAFLQISIALLILCAIYLISTL